MCPAGEGGLDDGARRVHPAGVIAERRQPGGEVGVEGGDAEHGVEAWRRGGVEAKFSLQAVSVAI
jgi:hypothetical protein